MEKPGQMVDLRKWEQHAADDELRAAAEDHLLYKALVTAVVPLKEKSPPEHPQVAAVRTDASHNVSQF